MTTRRRFLMMVPASGAVLAAACSKQEEPAAAAPAPAPAPAEPPAAAAPGNAPAGWGLVYERETTQVDTESLAIEAQGRVVTADGTEISFSLKVQMQSTRISTSSTTLRAGDAVLKDPHAIYAGHSHE